MKGEVDFCPWNGSAENNFLPHASSFKKIRFGTHISLYFFWCYRASLSLKQIYTQLYGDGDFSFKRALYLSVAYECI